MDERRVSKVRPGLGKGGQHGPTSRDYVRKLWGSVPEDKPSEIIGLSIRLVGVVGGPVLLEIWWIYLREKV